MCSYLENPFNYLNQTTHSGCVRQGNYHLGQGHSADVWSRSHDPSVVRQAESVSRPTYSSGIQQSHFVNKFHHSQFSSTFENSNLCHLNHYRGQGNKIFSPSYFPTNTYHCESEPEYSTRNSREASNRATCGSCSSESMPSLDKIFSHSQSGDNSLLCEINDSNHSTYGSTDNKLQSGSSIESNLTDFAELREHIYRTFSEALKTHYSSRNNHHRRTTRQESVSISSCDSNTFKEICNQKTGDLDLRKFFPSKILRQESSEKLMKNFDITNKTKAANDSPSELNVLESEVQLIDLNDSIYSSNQNCDQWATDSSSLSLSSFHSDFKPSLSSSSLSLSDVMSAHESSKTDFSVSLSDLSGLSVHPSEESLLSDTSHTTANTHLPFSESGASYLNDICNTCSACDRNRSVIQSTRLTYRYMPYHIQRYYIHDSMYHKSIFTSDYSLNSRCRNILRHCGYCDQTGASTKQSAFTDHINIRELLLWIRNFRYRDKGTNFIHRPHFSPNRYSKCNCKCNCSSIGALNSANYLGATSGNEAMSFFSFNSSNLGTISSGGSFGATDPTKAVDTACQCKHGQVSAGKVDHREQECKVRGINSCRAYRQQLSGQSDQSQQCCRSMVVFTEPQGEKTLDDLRQFRFLKKLNEPRPQKTCLCHMQTTKAQISLHICAVSSAPLLFTAWIV